MTNNISIVNIADDKKEFDKAFSYYIKSRDIYQDQNHRNYDELWDRIDEYERFHLVYKNDAPLGMSGINDFYWKQKGVARIMDRAYQFQRFDTGFRNVSNRISWYLIEEQIKICEDKNIDTMFMSVSTFKRVHAYQKIIVNRINKKLNLDPGFVAQPHLYNVCRQTENINCEDGCWQGITVYHKNKNKSLVLPHREIV